MVGTLGRRGFLAGAGATGLVTASGTFSAHATLGHTSLAAATVILNGRVFTGRGGSGRLQAVAIGRNGTVLEVGSTAEVRRRIGRGTQVIDASGGTIMAGIHDGHMHPLGAAEQSLNPSLHNAELTVPELQAQLQAMLDATDDQEPDGWLQVTDWSPVGLLPAGTVADKSFLDALDTSRPILLQGSNFHNSFVNSRALALAGVDATTPNPDGGEIVRNAQGEATGLLKDNAQDVVRSVIPAPTPEQLEGAYADMATFLLGNGVTSFQDAASSEETIQTYADLIGRGLLLQQVTPALVIQGDLATSPSHGADYLEDLRKRYGSVPGIHLTTAKVFVDGVIEFPAQTAALLRPYLDEDGRPTDNYGDLYISDQEYRRLAVRLDREGWQLHSHAIGDAVRVALNAYQAALRANGRSDRRHTIAHLQLVHPHDYPRFARLGVLACMQLQWAVRNVWTLDALKPYIGQERFDRLYPARGIAAAGGYLSGGSDWPVDPFRPFNQIATAVDRIDPTGTDPDPLSSTQSLSVRESLRMHTRGGAFQLHRDDTGVVAPGKRADLIVLDRDLTGIQAGEIRGTQVQSTLIGGKVVYDADSTAARRAMRRGAATQAAAGTVHAAPRPGACCGEAHG